MISSSRESRAPERGPPRAEGAAATRRRFPSRPILTAIAVAAVFLLAGSGLAASGEQEASSEFIGVMSGYLELSDQLVEMAARPETSIYFAIEGIVEIHEARGERAEAITHLKRMLEQHGDNQTVRNLIRFKLRDLYNQTGQAAKALEQLEQVLKENS
ncbi:MAG: tetratricopeptide repeat protein [Holophagales bacterium]|nr:tetratricopeptide repeat protein [Holophagales bacterium]